jgi:hypothetical protein
MSTNSLNDRSEPFCDKLTVTTPAGSEKFVVENFEAFSTRFFMERSNETCYRSASNGSLTWGQRGGVTWYTTSGSFLSDLRAFKALDEYLCCFYSHPDNPQLEHRVTHLDATVDQYCYAPTALQSALDKGLAGEVKFTRKAVSPHDVKTFMSMCEYDDSGLLTGSIYFGGSKARVRSKMYDKRQQMLQMKRKEIPDTTRHELSVKADAGVTLKDASSPKALFYHFYPSNLLSKIAAPEWVPGETGYTVDRYESMPAMKLKTRVQCSNEVGAILKLASQSGERGIDYLCQLIRERYSKADFV